jgi:RNA polymerase sigma factor (sigma-70 family)
MRTTGASHRRVDDHDAPQHELRRGLVLVVSHDSEAEERQIAELMTKARAIAERVVRRHREIAAGDAEDVVSAATLRVAKRLLESSEAEEVVHDFENYVTTITFNAVSDHLRLRFPTRTRLKNRLRYLLVHDHRIALWSTRRGMVCGLAEWHGKPPVDRGLAEDIDERIAGGDALIAFFRRHGHPVSLDALVERAAAASDMPARLLPQESRTPAAPQSSAYETQETLTQLWNELLQLRPMQRKALLFNLRDAEGSHPLDLLVLTGVASTEALASALELTPAKLYEIWRELPYSDLQISAMLGVTRQQVINLRKSARERLARRMYATSMRRAARTVTAQETAPAAGSPIPSDLLRSSVDTASEGARAASSDPVAADNHAMRLEAQLAELFMFREIGPGFALAINALLMALRYRDTLLIASQWNAILTMLERVQTSPRLAEDEAVQLLLDLENAGLRTSPPELEAVAETGRDAYRHS